MHPQLFRILSLACFLFASGQVFAQYNGASFLNDITYNTSRPASRDWYSAYLAFGPSAYHGEMANVASFLPSGAFGYNFRDVRIARATLGGELRFSFYHPLSLRGEFSVYTLKGSDSLGGTWRKNKRQLSFEATNYELWVGPQLEWLKYDTKVGLRAVPLRITSYVYTGLGVTTNFPTTVLDGQRINLWELETEGEEYSNYVLAWPMGIGIKLRLTNGYSLGVDFGYRITSTDYLDDVSGYYADTSSFDNPIAQYLADPTGTRVGGEQRGNPQQNDGYMFTSVTIGYHIPKNVFGANQFGTSRRIRGRGTSGARRSSTNKNWFKNLFSGNNTPRRRPNNRSRGLFNRN